MNPHKMPEEVKVPARCVIKHFEGAFPKRKLLFSLVALLLLAGMAIADQGIFLKYDAANKAVTLSDDGRKEKTYKVSGDDAKFAETLKRGDKITFRKTFGELIERMQKVK